MKLLTRSEKNYIQCAQFKTVPHCGSNTIPNGKDNSKMADILKGGEPPPKKKKTKKKAATKKAAKKKTSKKK